MPVKQPVDTSLEGDLFTEDQLDDDLFEPPPTEWIKLEDLAAGGFRPNGTLPGRSALFYPETVQLEIPGDNNGKPYNALFGTLVILDGPLNETVDHLPFVIENMKLNGAWIVPNILGMFRIDPRTVLGGRDNEHRLIPKDERKFFTGGRLNSKKNSKNTLSWFFEKLDDEGKKRAKRYHSERMRSMTIAGIDD